MTAVILAGGRSRRFGSDKLDPTLGLLSELALSILPDFDVILVGNPRDLGLPDEARLQAEARLCWVPDDQPGAGPGAGMLTGVRVALSQQSSEPVVVLPGDAPGGAAAARGLITALSSGASAACPRHGDALLPLPCALSAMAGRRLLDHWADRDADGVSVRALLAPLAPIGVDLPPEAIFDIDTPDDLRRWRQDHTEPKPHG